MSKPSKEKILRFRVPGRIFDPLSREAQQLGLSIHEVARVRLAEHVAERATKTDDQPDGAPVAMAV